MPLLKNMEREQELYDEIKALENEIHSKLMEIEDLKRRLSVAKYKYEQVRSFIANDIKDIMKEPQ